MRLQGSTSSPIKVDSRQRVVILWNLECPVGLSQKRICVHFSEENLVQFGWSAKINSGAMKCFGFNGQKVAHFGWQLSNHISQYSALVVYIFIVLTCT